MVAQIAESIPLVWNEALSGIFGSISLACWIFLLVPQVYENYRSHSAAGLSLAFLIVWFIGDLANFLGALLAGLVPTVIALSIWYLFADAALLSQVIYYNHITNNQKPGNASEPNGSAAADGSAVDENAPLLRRSSTDVPGSRRRSSVLSRRRSSTNAGASGLAAVQEETGSTRRAVLKNAGAILAICAVGTAGWAVAYGVGAWRPTPPPTPRNKHGDDENLAALILGYVSAVAYLGARIPQIVKNFRDQSCEGLSLLFFILSMMGNITYGAQILLHSTERGYVITNLPWLIGSVGTVGEDLVIFIQFRLYRKNAAGTQAEA